MRRELSLSTLPCFGRLNKKKKKKTMLPDAYGCVVANRFGNLLDDEADPFDLINEVETEKGKKKKKKKKEGDEQKGKQKKPGQRESQKDRRVPIVSDVHEPAPGNV